MISRKAPEQHINHALKAFSLLCNVKATLMFKKCSFFTNTIDYVGHAILPSRQKLASHTTDDICGSKLPTNFTKLRSCLGVWNVFRRLVPNFARIMSLLTDWRKFSQTNLHRLTVKNFKPWIYRRALWYHHLCWNLHILWTNDARHRRVLYSVRLCPASKATRRHYKTHWLPVTLSHRHH